MTDFDSVNGNWKRLATRIAVVTGLVALLAAFSDPLLRVLPWATKAQLVEVAEEVEQVESADERQNRVLRCLLRADPRQGPAIDQCDGDPLRGQ